LGRKEGGTRDENVNIWLEMMGKNRLEKGEKRDGTTYNTLRKSEEKKGTLLRGATSHETSKKKGERAESRTKAAT